MELKVIPWTWRDGSVHLEMRLASFHEGDTLVTHLDGPTGRFVTACGTPWWGIGSSSGIAHTERVSCEACRTLLASLTFSVEVRDPVERKRDQEGVLSPPGHDPDAWAKGYGVPLSPDHVEFTIREEPRS